MNTVAEIRKLELCKEQGTDDWLAIREGMFTASDIASILGMGTGNFKSVMDRKLGLKESFFGNSWVLDRGTLMEDVALHKYALKEGKKIERFGLLRHPTIPWLGGSPDGITTDGILLEVKCPTTRKIEHKVPRHYLPQVQILLEITGLDKAAFIQYRPSKEQENYKWTKKFRIDNKDEEILDILYVDRDPNWFADWLPVLQKRFDEYQAKVVELGSDRPKRVHKKRNLGWDLYYNEEDDNVVQIRPVCTLMTNKVIPPH